MARLVGCQKCGELFDKPKGSNRLNCTRCAPPRLAPDDTVTPIRPVQEYSRPLPVSPQPPGRHERMTEAELIRLGQDQTVEGVIALGLAQALDGHELPGAQRSSMAKQLLGTLAELRALVPPEPDELNSWQDRARRKREEAAQ